MYQVSDLWFGIQDDDLLTLRLTIGQWKQVYTFLSDPKDEHVSLAEGVQLWRNPYGIWVDKWAGAILTRYRFRDPQQLKRSLASQLT